MSKTHAVLVALKRGTEDLGSYQKKLVRIDDHLGIALAGLAPDARVLSTYMRQQAMRSKTLFRRPIPVSRIVQLIGDKAQDNTQSYGRRPYGVGLLVAGVDETGPHLWEFLPSGSILEFRADSIGARSQSAKTYLERTFEEFGDASKEDLVLHGLKSLRESLAQDKELTVENTSISVIGVGEKYELYDNEDVKPWLEKLGDVSSSRNRAAREREQQEQAERERNAAAADSAPPTTTTTTDPPPQPAPGGDAMEE